MTDKEYDLFFIYSSENGKEAKSLMEQLEGRFQIRCCFADRDFLPGTEIAENIAIFMEQSDKVLMLITPDFISSGWCWHEIHEAFRKYTLEKRRHCIIPVLLESVQEMPKLLRNFTYIDFNQEADPAEKIHKTFLANPEERYHEGREENEENIPNSLRSPQLWPESFPYSYNDDFEINEERIKFLEEETDKEILQTYFDEASKGQDVCLLQTILENKHAILNPTNVFNFCVHFRRTDFTQELTEAVFQKIDKELRYVDFEQSYVVACSRGCPYLVAKFNETGCQKLINVSFVEKLIIGSSLCGEEENEQLTGMMKATVWTEEDLLVFLDAAIRSMKPKIIKNSISLLSRIPFNNFLQMIFIIDEQCCLDVLRKVKYQDQKDMQGALTKACIMNMETLAREILKLGPKLSPNLLRPGFSDRIVKILVQEYPWTSAELNEMKQFITKPISKGFLHSEIRKRLANV